MIRLAGVDAELAASRQRLLAAEDSGRRQVASAIRVGVVSGLREVPDRLEGVVAVSPARPGFSCRLVDGCVATTTEALEQLRDITRTISPPMLAQRGLHAALAARRSPPGATVDVRSAAGARGRGGRRTSRPAPTSAARSSCAARPAGFA